MSSAQSSVLQGGAATGPRRLSAIDLQRITAILEACGVSKVHGSTHIYAHPESIHLISPRDLSFLVLHADVLATHTDLLYDVRAFTGILWGMMQHADRGIERVLRAVEGNSAAAAESARGGSVGGTPSSSSPAPAPAHTFVYTNVSKVYSAMFPHLVQVFRVATLLRAYESTDARAEVRDTRRIAQVDIDVVARLAGRLNHLFLCEAGERSAGALGGAGALNVTATYTNVGHHLFRTTESALSSVLLLLSSLAARPGSDAGPILRYFHDVGAWKASALGILITESYSMSIQAVLFSLFRRSREFDNVEEVAAKLLLQRLASRPPYQWRTFRLLYFSVQDIGASDMQAAEDRHGSSAFGQLLVFCRIQHALQWCLTTDGRDSADEHATVKSLRKAVSAQVQRAWSEQSSADRAGSPSHKSRTDAPPRLLSYYELLVLAALQGMPEADLTKDAELLRRAEQTKLSAEPEVLTPTFLRMLIAFCYTVPAPTDPALSHAMLSTSSTLALYESLAKHIFQIPLCASAAVADEVNQLFATAALRTDTLVDLCVWSAIHNTREDELELAEGVAAKENSAAAAANPAVVSPAPHARARAGPAKTAGLPLPPIPSPRAAEVSTEAAMPSLPPPPTPATALFHLMRRDVSLLFAGNEDVLQYTPEAARARAKNFPYGFRTMTLTTVRLLFAALRTAELYHHIPPTDMLPVIAQLFALRAYYPLSPSETEAERKAARRMLALMQNTLALLPQEMKATTVNQLLCRTLVPMSTMTGQADQLQLALFEAYLRSMATASAANAVTDELMLQHWVDIAVPAITNRHSVTLSIAGHDFLIAAFRAEKYVSPLFVPTYIALYVPSVELFSTGGSVGQRSTYSPLPVSVIQHFARMVRAACHGIERCDSTALARLFEEAASREGEATMPGSVHAAAAYMASLSPAQRAALRKLTPTNAVLLVVSALFDCLCLLWNNTPGYVKVAQDLFVAYFSGLCNLLQCASTPVLQRVCASIEAIEVEHLRGSGNVQLQFLKYVSSVVDAVQGPSKVGIAEWFLKMNKRIQEQNYGKHSKL
ncbi:conserved hypothetical protein [Leishmania infantum JPCM5]|uniref:Uncharacterized protein n=2 Tax=Leishmania infantum TaxID=5671 RepID=A4IDN1_LEIIN|nr:conserved hypothetical protein [Leishmania infantum JPCM5]CAC9551939.1 hypothetical_protein_-_conserved [Leishmania infantum]CAM72962.2 conserved hypothetical protein [Leishmania infantum JPCM5]SUZ46853.1 hypothetical_protein_-_conserved [Leishmania infantum]|eukprot:XP_001469850.2 conserved hypothetical protein [Leishmania infantum JPCM5]